VGLLRWEWTLANRGSVSAVVDTDLGVETVLQGERLLSEAQRGSRSEGHTVLVEAPRDPDRSERPPIEAVVTFDPLLPICILRVDGHDVAPSAWPVRQRVASPPPTSPPWGSYILGALFVVAAFVALYTAVTRIREASGAKLGPLDGTHRARNGLFIAHYPEDLSARPAVLPSDVGGIRLENKAKTTFVVLAAAPADFVGGQDPWALQKRLLDEALANVPKGHARYEEVSRNDETCVGERGAVVTGILSESGTTTARIWSCAFEHDGAGYLALTMVTEPTTAETTKAVRGIVDATELTHLAELGSAPEPALSGATQ
jgi:hypothetical protein